MFHAKQSELSRGDNALLQEILTSLRSIQQENSHLAAAVDAINGRVNILAGVKQMQDGTVVDATKQPPAYEPTDSSNGLGSVPASSDAMPEASDATILDTGRRSSIATSKIILTSYPNQAGVDPLPMKWGDKDPNTRGPVVVSRNPNTIRRRNGKCWSNDTTLSQCLTTSHSHWRPWRIILYIQCSGSS